ncbi:hypothetical protein GCM10027589_05510 [Actinocorallia lasiicapitis]
MQQLLKVQPKWVGPLVGVTAAGLVAGLSLWAGGSRERPDRQVESVVTPTRIAFSARPGNVSAAVVLEGLAAKAGAQPAVGGGAYSYILNKGWALQTKVAGNVSSGGVERSAETWAAADGEGEIRTKRFGVREVVKSTAEDSFYNVSLLSADPERLAGQLAVGHPVANGPAERLIAVTDLLSYQVLPPELQAAVLRVLAAEKALEFQGDVTDRLGRRGVAIGVDSAFGGLPTRYTLIFDARTGALLGEEQSLTGSPGSLGVAPGSLLGYSLWVRTGRVSAIGDVP